jgi:hypothetical protein
MHFVQLLCIAIKQNPDNLQPKVGDFITININKVSYSNSSQLTIKDDDYL